MDELIALGRGRELRTFLRTSPSDDRFCGDSGGRVCGFGQSVEEATVQEVAVELCRAARGCAQAIGNSVDIERIQGYASFTVDKDLHILLRSVAASTGVKFVEEDFSAASTDMGDISQIKPAIIVGLPGSNGRFHSPEFQVTDEQAAYVFPAEILEAYLTRLVEQT